jgi:hypothetical protein
MSKNLRLTDEGLAVLLRSSNARIAQAEGVDIDRVHGRRAAAPAPQPHPPSKHRNVKTVREGRVIHSRKEAGRLDELRMMERAGVIRNLMTQVPFQLSVNGHHICDYRADFVYTVSATGVEVVEDVKSPHSRTLPDYRLKFKLFRAIFGREIREV